MSAYRSGRQPGGLSYQRLYPAANGCAVFWLGEGLRMHSETFFQQFLLIYMATEATNTQVVQEHQPFVHQSVTTVCFITTAEVGSSAHVHIEEACSFCNVSG